MYSASARTGDTGVRTRLVLLPICADVADVEGEEHQFQ